MKVYILFHGYRNNSRGYAVAAFRTKKRLRAYIAKQFPEFKPTGRFEPNEMYWQDDHAWLKSEDEAIKVIE
jgi:hypothetical protein